MCVISKTSLLRFADFVLLLTLLPSIMVTLSLLRVVLLLFVLFSLFVSVVVYSHLANQEHLDHAATSIQVSAQPTIFCLEVPHLYVQNLEEKVIEVSNLVGNELSSCS